jgi:hypothetical protein
MSLSGRERVRGFEVFAVSVKAVVAVVAVLVSPKK